MMHTWFVNVGNYFLMISTHYKYCTRSDYDPDLINNKNIRKVVSERTDCVFFYKRKKHVIIVCE